MTVALCGMKCRNQMKEAMKVIGADFICNKKLEHEMNFQSHIRKIESFLRLQSMWN